MSLEENKQLIQRLFEEVINNNRTELLDEIFVPGSMIAASFKDSVFLVRTAFPDARVTIDHMVGEDDQVVVVFTVAGENAGPFMGRAPTGQSILFTGIHYYRIRNERIYTARYEHDLLGLMEQLGMIPSENRPDI
ncbi:MAG: ester cyclase [Chloroflexi bacterium]|nr:ester cyclase [Chloroflexota bacterium]